MAELTGKEKTKIDKIARNRVRTLYAPHYPSGMMLLFAWIAGVLLAKGFMSTLFAVLIPSWAFVILIDKVLSVVGLQ